MLRRQSYAVAALLGAAVALAERVRLPRPGFVLVAILLVFGVRTLALYRKWSAPVVAPYPD